MEIIKIRRSIRKYQEKRIEKEKIDLILKAAMQAPSARNQQPWRFIVCENKEKNKELALKISNMKFLSEAPLTIIFLTDLSVLTVPSMYSQDLSASIENAILEATSLQIGSCWCGTYPNKERMDIVKEMFNLNSNLEPFAVVGFGYPSDEDAFKFIDRFDKNKIVSWENDNA